MGEPEEFPPSERPAGLPQQSRQSDSEFPGDERKNDDTHQSTTGADARSFRRTTGSAAKLAYIGHLLIENRHGLIVDAMVTAAAEMAERDAALTILGDLHEGRARELRVIMRVLQTSEKAAS